MFEHLFLVVVPEAAGEMRNKAEEEQQEKSIGEGVLLELQNPSPFFHR